MANKPKIRFKGFDDAWEQRKLGEIATETYGGGTPKTSNEEFWKGDIPWIQSSDLIDECLFDVRPRKCISQEAVSKSATKLVPQNSIAIVTRVGVGKLAFMPFSYATSQDFLSLSGLKIDPEFTVYALFKMMQSVSNEVQGTSIKGVTKDELLAKKIIFPSCNEQKKIGAYLHNLDHLITLHQRKYLQKKKTSLTWKQCKLEDVMDTVTDYVAAGSFEDIRNNVTYLNEPGYAQLVRTVDLKKKFTNNDSVYVDESAFKYLWRVNLNDECIVLPNIGANIGEVYFVEPSGLPYDNNVLGPNAILLKANEDTYFAFTALNNLTFQKQLFENVGSSGQPKFNKTELKSIQLYMPQNEEQVKIEQYFRQLDHLITLHRRAHFHRRRRTYK